MNDKNEKAIIPLPVVSSQCDEYDGTLPPLQEQLPPPPKRFTLKLKLSKVKGKPLLINM